MTSPSTSNNNITYIDKARAAVARAHLADQLQQQVQQLELELEEAKSREQHSRDKLQLIVDQFKGQTEQVKNSAHRALVERQRLEKESEILKKKNHEQASSISKLKIELDNALLLKKSSPSMSMDSPSRKNNDDSFFSSSSPSSENNKNKRQNQHHHLNSSPSMMKKQNDKMFEPANSHNSSSIVMLSPPPASTTTSGAMDNNSTAASTSIAFGKRHSLLDSRRHQQQQQQNISSSASAGTTTTPLAQRNLNNNTSSTTTPIMKNYFSSSDNHHHNQHHFNTAFHRQLSSARLAARIAVALFPSRIQVEKCVPSIFLNSMMNSVFQQKNSSSYSEGNFDLNNNNNSIYGDEQQQQHKIPDSLITAFRVGQLVGGWWKFSVASVPVNNNNTQKNATNLSQLPLTVSSSLAMNKPPRGTSVDFSSSLQSQAEAALCSTAEDFFQNSASRFHNVVSTTNLGLLLSNNNNNQNNSKNNNSNSNNEFTQQLQQDSIIGRSQFPVSAVEFLASWTGLRPTQLRAVNLTTQHELEVVLDRFVIPFSSSSSSNYQQKKGGGKYSSSSTSSSSILYLSNPFNRKECFVVDSSRMGNDRFCCCVFVNLGNNNNNQKNNNSSFLPNLEASWLTLSEIRQYFSACVRIDFFQQDDFDDEEEDDGFTVQDDKRNKFSLPLSMSSPNTTFGSISTTTEIRIPCLLSALQGGQCVDLAVVVRNISTECGLEPIEQWMSRFSCDFYICDVPMFVKHERVLKRRRKNSVSTTRKKKERQEENLENENDDFDFEYKSEMNKNENSSFFDDEYQDEDFSIFSSSPNKKNKNKSSPKQSNQTSSSTTSLRADIACEGQIRWTFAQNDNINNINNSNNNNLFSPNSPGAKSDKSDNLEAGLEYPSPSSRYNYSNKNKNVSSPPSSPSNRVSFVGSSASPSKKTSTSTPTKNQNSSSSPNNNKNSTNLTSIVMKFRCSDANAVSRAVASYGGLRSTCPAVCILSVPSPSSATVHFPTVQFSSSSSTTKNSNNNFEKQQEEFMNCCIPNQTTLTIQSRMNEILKENEREKQQQQQKQKQQQKENNNINNNVATDLYGVKNKKRNEKNLLSFLSKDLNTVTFQINGETFPSSSGNLQLICCSDFSSSSSSQKQQQQTNNNTNLKRNLVKYFNTFQWKMLSVSGIVASNFLFSNSNSNNNNPNLSSLSPVPQRTSGFSANLHHLAKSGEKDDENDESLLSSSDSRKTQHQLDQGSVRNRAYQVFALGLTAASTWLTTASNWMSRFNAYKALLLFESCRATEAEALKNAAWLRKWLMTPLDTSVISDEEVSIAMGQDDTDTATTPLSKIIASPTTSHYHHQHQEDHQIDSSNISSSELYASTRRHGNNNTNNSSQQSRGRSLVAGTTSRWTMFMLVYRFTDWMMQASELYAWYFDGLVSTFFESLTSNRLAVGATDRENLMSIVSSHHHQQQDNSSSISNTNINISSSTPSKQNFNNNYSNSATQQHDSNNRSPNSTSLAKNIFFFNSPAIADGGDEFLLEGDWSALARWQHECTRSRLELLLHYSDSMVNEAANSFAAQSIQFQSEANEMMRNSKMEVFANKVAEALKNQNNSNNNQQQYSSSSSRNMKNQNNNSDMMKFSFEQNFGENFDDQDVEENENEEGEYDNGLIICSLKLRLASLESQFRQQREDYETKLQQQEEKIIIFQQQQQQQQGESKNIHHHHHQSTERSSSNGLLDKKRENYRSSSQQKQQKEEEEAETLEETNPQKSSTAKQQRRQLDLYSTSSQNNNNNLKKSQQEEQEKEQEEFNEEQHFLRQHQQLLANDALSDRCTALQMECDALALRLDASEKHNAATTEKCHRLQLRLEQTQHEASEYLGEIQRLRDSIDSQVQLSSQKEKFGMQRELQYMKTNMKQLEEENMKKDAIITQCQEKLEIQQKERMEKYSQMLKEFSHNNNDVNTDNSSSYHRDHQYHSHHDVPVVSSNDQHYNNNYQSLSSHYVDPLIGNNNNNSRATAAATSSTKPTAKTTTQKTVVAPKKLKPSSSTTTTTAKSSVPVSSQPTATASSSSSNTVYSRLYGNNSSTTTTSNNNTNNNNNTTANNSYATSKSPSTSSRPRKTT